jgi:hypothetical protein
VIKRTIEQRRRALAHSNAVADKNRAAHAIALLRLKYLDALRSDDVLTKAALDVEF